MNKRFTLALFFLISWMFLSATPARDSVPYVINGCVVEAESKQVSSYVSVQLLQVDSAFVMGVRTDEKGIFRLAPKSAGSYLVVVECTGYERLCQVVTLSKDQPTVNLETLALQPSATLLKDLEVTAARSQVTMKGDTLVYNADAFRVPPGSSLGTLLSRLPGITVENGVIKYHGKEVNKLLINGKEFFSGDMSIALENLPTEVVENIQAYETRTDEDKQKHTDSGERLNVLDVTIKKEYMSTWIGNTDLAAGTSDRYSTRLFLTRFTDRLNVSAFGQINNLNDQSEASSDGGWRSDGWTPGLNTFRKMGVNVAWDNGKKEEEAGYLKIYGSARASHDNYNVEEEAVGESFYPGASRNYSNNLNGRKESWNTVAANGGITWQIDSMTNVYAKVDFSHTDQHRSGYARAATFDANPYRIPGVTDPLASIFSEAPNDSLLRATVNRNDRHTLGFSNSNQFESQFSIGRKLNSKGHRLDLWTLFSTSKKDDTDFSLSDIRYYRQQTGEPQHINNQHSLRPNTDRTFFGQLGYEHVLSKAQRLIVGYSYGYGYSQDDYTLYQLDSLESWRNTQHPVGSLPSADSLATTINWRNSSYATYEVSQHAFFVQYRLMDKKNFNVVAACWAIPTQNRMDYARESLDTLVVAHRLYFNPYFWVKYKLKGEGYIQFQYRANRDFPKLTQMLDITDDRDPLVIVKGNPNLKDSWSHRFHLGFQSTFGERKTSVWANAGYETTDTEVGNTETYDPVTGVRTIRPENVDGTWSTYTSLGANIPLDDKQRLNLSPSINASYRHNVGFFTSTEDHVSLLNAQTNFECIPRLNLNYRLDKLYLATDNSLFLGIDRNSLQPDGNQTCRILNTGVNAQYEFAWGLTLSSDFHLYSCRGFTSPTMNNDQWLWNASISQSFLKKKNLIVSVEAKDVLGQRLNEWSTSTSYGRSTNHNNSFRNMSYVMCHLIYRFSIGKKAD